MMRYTAQYGEREGNGTISGRESGAGEKILRSMQASIQVKRKVVARNLDDETKRVYKEGGVEKEKEGLKRDEDNSDE